jgi:hypothetical protein
MGDSIGRQTAIIDAGPQAPTEPFNAESMARCEDPIIVDADTTGQ